MTNTQHQLTRPDEPIHIVHVDDEPDFARMVTENLEVANERFTVHATTDPTEVASIVADGGVDCVLSDYQMPEMTGLDVLSEVQAIDSSIPVILFTDTGSESVASEAISAGVSDYIIKETVKEQYELLANKIRTQVERERAEAIANRTQQQLHELAENTNDALWIFSADWSELQYINSRYEDLFGQSVESLYEDPTVFLEATHPDDLDDVKQAMERASEGNPQVVAYRINDGNTWVESHAEPIVNDSGTVVRVVGFTHDITDRKQRELDLVEQNERLERFASIVSHDLRNPLSVADGYLEMARDEADSDHLATVGDALDRMKTLIDEILTLAREGDEITDTTLVALDTLAMSSWSNIDQRAAAATLHANTDVRIEADKVRLAQVFENLFRNAIEHGGADVSITVGVLPTGEGFYVENDGEPIPEDAKEQIFETGYTTNKQGTGFGLAIIKRIVTAHGWEIDVTDGSEGGARFEITGMDLLNQHDTVGSA